MSLKDFHILFILSSIVLSLGFAFWAWQQYVIERQNSFLLAFVGAIVFSVVLAVYDVNFIRKVK